MPSSVLFLNAKTRCGIALRMGTKEEVERAASWEEGGFLHTVCISVPAVNMRAEACNYPPAARERGLRLCPVDGKDQYLRAQQLDQAADSVLRALELVEPLSPAAAASLGRPDLQECKIVDVLIHCNGSVHRTPPVATAVVHRVLGLDPADILGGIRRARPRIWRPFHNFTADSRNPFDMRGDSRREHRSWEAMQWAFHTQPKESWAAFADFSPPWLLDRVHAGESARAPAAAAASGV